VRAPILAVNVDPPDAYRCARSNHKMLFRREPILASAVPPDSRRVRGSPHAALMLSECCSSSRKRKRTHRSHRYVSANRFQVAFSC